MELLCTLSKLDRLEKIVNSGVDGLIFGSAFSLCFDYDLQEFDYINDYCLKHNIKRYVSIDAIIFEEDKAALYDYLNKLKDVNPDGIYFADLGIIRAAKNMGLKDKLIYDPNTLITNSADAAFYVKQGIGVVLARELSLEEIEKIISNLPNQIDMQIFGHLRMSYSKRKFLSNYFKHINKDIDINSKRTIRIVEENRNYSMPIVEDKYGTRIYTDYILQMYREFLRVKDKLKRAIIDDSFIDVKLVASTIKDTRKLTEENVEFLLEASANYYANENFSTGYLDNKTTKTKEENE